MKFSGSARVEVQLMVGLNKITGEDSLMKVRKQLEDEVRDFIMERFSPSKDGQVITLGEITRVTVFHLQGSWHERPDDDD